MNRATKSGFAAEAQAKVNSKYSEDQATECLQWINAVTGESVNTSGSQANFWEVLKDGQLLCKVINALKPGTIKKIQTMKVAFKCMENITQFVEGAKACGVPTTETFQSVDLWEQQNLNSVIICIQSLGRKGSKFGKQSIGPKEANKNVREFTDEQLNAGQNVIGLQMGSNKGASQAGLNMGQTRHM